MCNRFVWLAVFIFWSIVILIDGWRGVGIVLAFSGAIMLVIGLIERSAKRD